MLITDYQFYTLILTHTPDDVFDYYKVDEMHGLKRGDHIHGWCNLSPEDNKPYVFINLSNCKNDVLTTTLVYHEMMHLSGYKFREDWRNHEEEMITFAEEETYKTVDLIKKVLWDEVFRDYGKIGYTNAKLFSKWLKEHYNPPIKKQ